MDVTSDEAVAALRRATQAAAGIGALWLIDAGLAGALEGMGVPFPSSVAGMLLGVSALLVMDQYRVGWAERVAAGLEPAVQFLGRWMALFFVPPLVMLPMAPMPAPGELARLVGLVVGGVLFTLVTTAWIAQGLARLVGAQPPEPLRPSVSRWPLARVVGLWAGVALLALGLQRAEVPGASVGVWLGVTVAAYAAGGWAQAWLGSRLPPGLGLFGQRVVVSVFHPVLFGALTTIGALHLVAVPFDAYLASDVRHPGAGDLLMTLLNPAVVALGVLLYRQRALLRAYAGPLVGALVVAAPLSLGTAALAAGWLGLSPSYALAVIPRSVTTPIAIPIAELLGATPGITAAIVVLTGVLGAVFGGPVLEALGIHGAAARGLGMGASAHGIGTAALVMDDPPAAAVSGVAFALMAALSALVVSLPPAYRLLVDWAMGG